MTGRTWTIEVAETAKRHGRFMARLEGRLLCTSRQPLLACARILLAEGADPDDWIAMRHAGADHLALRAKIGVAAKLTVRDKTSDGVPRFAPWDEPPSVRLASPMRSDEEGVSQTGEGVHASGEPRLDVPAVPPSSTDQP